ncbi:hypothetical protein Pmani_028202 [Petrolisthes manimaculis]|uniref:Uncharacterized protein n=1 Tax=Petrolisthes manimaculis TaxID=1843537 RepID=A0AAE1NZY5_9EUCA|nr:hypothetical protein Pmani_028202 [Petrolisthes manimaculis]
MFADNSRAKEALWAYKRELSLEDRRKVADNIRLENPGYMPVVLGVTAPGGGRDSKMEREVRLVVSQDTTFTAFFRKALKMVGECEDDIERYVSGHLSDAPLHSLYSMHGDTDYHLYITYTPE